MISKRNGSKALKVKKMNSNQLSMLIREELKPDCKYDNGKLSIVGKHINRYVQCLEDVEKVNSEYEALELKFQETGYFEKIILTLPSGSRLDKFDELSDDIYRFKGEKYYFQLLAQLIIDPLKCRTEKWRMTVLLREFNTTIDSLMDDDEKLEFEKLPEKLTIYRGVSILEKDDQLEAYISLSWTLDYEVAQLHAIKNTGFPVIFKYEIEKEDVLAFFTRNDESEILCHFIDIDFEKVEAECWIEAVQ